jgi:hypothetical protein
VARRPPRAGRDVTWVRHAGRRRHARGERARRRLASAAAARPRAHAERLAALARSFDALARATAGAGAKLSDPSAAAGMSGEVEAARRAASAITAAA